MSDLSAYLNVYNTALVVLSQKGWHLRLDAAREQWYATKEKWELMADDPIQLLGLVAIHEHHAPAKKMEYWWKIDQPDLLSKLDPEAK